MFKEARTETSAISAPRLYLAATTVSRPLNTGYMGHVDISLLPVNMIEKVQVIKGPASVAYGANSLGGVVNIITRTDALEPLKVHIKSLFDDNAYRLLSAGIAGNRNDYNICINTQELHRDGYSISSNFSPTDLENGNLRDNSDHHRQGVNLKIGHTLPNGGQYSLSLGHITVENGLPISIYKPRYWRFVDWNRTTGSFTIGLLVHGTFTLKANIFGNLYDYELCSYVELNINTVHIDSCIPN
ncbi:MAG: TonB-dependent receptor plug domain-containing protein [Candidatus Hatepunaea meridiana]|nr:TonB-dependent receptor plug domain-containing protein [Candidatus Hatepunaea meridiana]